MTDNSPGVVGAAASAFASVCPTNLPLIGRNYKRLCEILPDVEEWGQIVLIGILLRYVIARHGLVRESIMLSPYSNYRDSDKDVINTDVAEKDELTDIDSAKQQSKLVDMVSKSYLEGPEKYLSHLGCVGESSLQLDSSKFTSSKNDDVKILLQCTSPLLWSQNSAVVLAAAGVHWIMAPIEDIIRIVKPLLFTLRSSRASTYVVHYSFG